VRVAFLANQPIARVEWVPADALQANDYNPNVQPPPEFRLLKISLLEDGWTQPIVVFDDGAGGKPIIVDGEHRWRVTREDLEVASLTGGLVPIVRIKKPRGALIMSTVRHNRARGEHRVKQMAAIVRELLESGHTPEDIGFLMQMEEEEITRLADRAGMPERGSRGTDDFSKGWIPG
jgi:ParB-like chromosome segregation protein Spo0J